MPKQLNAKQAQADAARMRAGFGAALDLTRAAVAGQTATCAAPSRGT